MAKFCGNCGSKMDDDAKICGMCGTPFPVQDAAPRENVNLSGGIPQKSATSSDGTLFVMYLLETIMFVLMGIFFLVKTFKAELFGFSEGFTMVELFDEVEFIPIIICVLIFLCAILSLVPMFSGAISKHRRLIASKVVPVLTLASVLLIYIIETNEEDAFYEFSLTFSGWLLVLLSIASFVLSFIISKKTKTKI